MTYATLTNLIGLVGERELIQLTDRAEPPTDQIDEGVALGALQAAADEIDSYVGAIYALPLAEPSQLLKDICLDLARYRLFKDPTDEVARRRKASIDHLVNISKGIAKIPGALGKDPVGRDGVVAMTGPGRRLTRDSMAGW